ncbi:MAG: hypothetical protein D6788_07745 [Planctomycetota bacterium]|nr:MAG: hypothetical protein D6788_07745 [Planctomycetota bacterium]
MADAYMSLDFLRIEGKTIAPPFLVRYESEMTKTGFETVVYKIENGAEQLLFAIGLRDGRVTEIRPTWQYREDGSVVENVEIKYDTPTPQGPGDLITHNDIEAESCLAGSYLQTWLHDADDGSVSLLTRRIREGKRLPDAEVETRPCYVVAWDSPNFPPDDYWMRQIYYFDQKTFFLRKWDTLVSEEGKPLKLQRSRIITKIETEPKKGRRRGKTLDELVKRRRH